jgi:DNA-binding NarL/FixJ family response regulator
MAALNPNEAVSATTTAAPIQPVIQQAQTSGAATGAKTATSPIPSPDSGASTVSISAAGQAQSVAHPSGTAQPAATTPAQSPATTTPPQVTATQVQLMAAEGESIQQIALALGISVEAVQSYLG